MVTSGVRFAQLYEFVLHKNAHRWDAKRKVKADRKGNKQKGTVTVARSECHE